MSLGGTFAAAVKVEQLWINGGRHRPAGRRPVYVVFDTGTTGMLVDKELFYNSPFEQGIFECHMKLRAEDGSMVTVGSSLRTCTQRCLLLTLPIVIEWPGVQKDAHVIFAGLAFMYNQGSLTIDADTRRLLLGGVPGSPEV